MRQTTSVKQHEVKETWFLINAKNHVLGRISVMIAKYLRGKHLPSFSPNINPKVHVIVLNAGEVLLTAEKEQKKVYYSHSGYPGGLKRIMAKDLRVKKPLRLLEKSIFGMLPHNRLGRQLRKNLHLYTNESHEFKNKQIKTIEVK